MKKVLVSIGSNTDGKRQMVLARGLLRLSFPGIRFTRTLTSPACPGEGIYSNMLAEFSTEMDEAELRSQLKQLEQQLGDSAELRKAGRVAMDIDLMQYGGTRHHLDDWNRPYILRLLRYAMRVVAVLLLSVATLAVHASEDDKELLGKAIEYYQGGKYHESILAFEQLNKHYSLNPRFIAYLGMSYYKEMHYEEAARYLSSSLPDMKVYSPMEQAVYAYSCAESFFRLERYREAIKYYEQTLPLVSGNDKGDVLFHDAFAHYFTQGATEEVANLFTEAKEQYRANVNTATSQQTARLRQTENMLHGIIENLGLTDMAY